MNYLLNSFPTLILAIFAGSVFIAAVVVGIWALLEKLTKKDVKNGQARR